MNTFKTEQSRRVEQASLEVTPEKLIEIAAPLCANKPAHEALEISYQLLKTAPDFLQEKLESEASEHELATQKKEFVESTTQLDAEAKKELIESGKGKAPFFSFPDEELGKYHYWLHCSPQDATKYPTSLAEITKRCHSDTNATRAKEAATQALKSYWENAQWNNLDKWDTPEHRHLIVNYYEMYDFEKESPPEQAETPEQWAFIANVIFEASCIKKQIASNKPKKDIAEVKRERAEARKAGVSKIHEKLRAEHRKRTQKGKKVAAKNQEELQRQAKASESYDYHP